MMRTQRHWGIATGLLVCCLFAAGAWATEPFTLRVGASGDAHIPLHPTSDLLAYQVGFRTDALPGYDPHDLPVPSSVPPTSGIVILYFTATDPDIAGYSKDFRPPAESQVWELRTAGMVGGSSVTLEWELEAGGGLAGHSLALIEMPTRVIRVADMTATTTYTVTNGPSGGDHVFLLLYGDPNHPPVAVGDEVFMLGGDSSVAIPFEDLLANDYDPDAGDSFDVVAVGTPVGPPDGEPPKEGTSEYGTTILDLDGRQIIYQMPSPLPEGWDGKVSFDYTIEDGFLLDSRQGSATVVVTVAPHILHLPSQRRIATQPATAVTLTYTLRYSVAPHSLALLFHMPVVDAKDIANFWYYDHGYADTDDATPDPVEEPGYGLDGLPGTGDDMGLVRLDFGTDVPASGTQLHFSVMVPANAAADRVRSSILYRLSGDETTDRTQRCGDVSITILYEALFLAGDFGALAGSATQYLPPGSWTTAVTALPDPGCHFVEWTRDGATYSTENPLAILMEAADIAVTAQFAVNLYDILFVAGDNGSVTGDLDQSVLHGTDTTPVNAVSNTGYHFLHWSRGGAFYSSENPVVVHATESLTLRAEFEINTYAVTFATDGNGTLLGQANQIVPYGGNSSPVTAVPNADYAFVGWNDGSTANPRTVTNVQSNVALTAQFVLVVPVDPEGEFETFFDDPANADGRSLWDLTGHYDFAAGNYNVALELQHDPKGTLTGTGTLTGALPGGAGVDIPLVIKGKAKGKAGLLTLKLGLSGSAGDASAKLKMTLARNGLNLDGTCAVSVKDKVAGSDKVTVQVTMNIPADMDGTYALTIDLHTDEKGKIVGDGLLRLSNGTTVDMLVKGALKGGLVTLQVYGNKGVDALFGAVKFKMGVETYSNGAAKVVWISGKGFGQSIQWP
ncbi:MAG: InlB B-repeat-containing protein [Lentisphaeria bacterium]|nr:InlB B-repeat-containing protein [Lentisphaeria bacterium]